MSRNCVEMVRISHIHISDLGMVSHKPVSKINSEFNIRDKSKELHNKSTFVTFIAVHSLILFIQQK
jgi:hypothetical protein